MSDRSILYQCVGLLGMGCVITSCAFTRTAFVSSIELDDIQTRKQGFRDVAVLDRQGRLELWPECYQETQPAETMFLVIPIPPARIELDGREKEVEDESFEVLLRTSAAGALSVEKIRITLRTSSGSHELKLVDDEQRSSNHHPVYRYSSKICCGEVEDGWLTIDGLDSADHEMGVNFEAKRRTQVAYHLSFRT